METILNQILGQVKSIKEGQDRLEAKVSSIENKISNLEEGQVRLEATVSSLEAKVSNLESKVSNLEESQDRLEIKVSNLSSQVSENTQILKALEHSAQVSTAEHDKMTHDIVGLTGEVKGAKRNIRTLEMITANNWTEIIELKHAK